MPTPLFILTLIVVPWLVGGAFDSLLAGFIALLFTAGANEVIWWERKKRYFASEQFSALSAQAADLVAEHNAVVEYVAEIRANGTFEVGASSSGRHAHLAASQNTSSWNYRRDRNVAEYAPHVHNASLQVVRNAERDPLKYVMKYFSIKADKDTLAEVQRLADSVARLEEAVASVEHQEQEITAKIDPPAFILRRYAGEFWKQVGVQLTPVTVPYPKYEFQYVSAGGNSSQKTSITLNTLTLEELSAMLVEKIRWAKSAAGQRALMTAKLRAEIKERDGYACRTCGVSVTEQPHLLLEVDHVIPVSKGGLSVLENLQTLCWRCNRTKGAKLPEAEAPSEINSVSDSGRVDYVRRPAT